MTESYSRGPQAPPLLEQTIGCNLDATIGRFGGREALVSCHQGLRYSWSELGDAVDEVARGLVAAGLVKGDRLGIWSPNCAEWTLVQFASARLGVILVNVNPAYQTSELEYVLRQSGTRMLISAASHKSSDYRAMVAQVRSDLPELESVVFLGSDDWASLVAGGAGVDPGPRHRDQRGARARRPDQHPVHERHHRFPQGRDAHPPKHPQQRLPRRRGRPLLRGRPGLHPGAVLPLLRDGDGQPRVLLARRRDGDPSAVVRA